VARARRAIKRSNEEETQPHAKREINPQSSKADTQREAGATMPTAHGRARSFIMSAIESNFVLKNANKELLGAKNAFAPAWSGLDETVSDSAWGPLNAHALTIQVNLESLGFSLPSAFLRQLSWQPIGAVGAFYNELDAVLRAKSGAHRVFQPMYPNFPKDVMEATDAELAQNAADHYAGAWIGERILPPGRASERAREQMKARKPQELSVWSVEQALGLATAWAQANGALAPSDLKALAALWGAADALGRLGQLAEGLAGAPNKENLARVGAIAATFGRLDAAASQMTGATDALRLAAALSEGDASLAEATKFKNFSRPARRQLLAVVERHLTQGDATQALENLFERRERWLRLAEKLHPGEFEKAFPNAHSAFARLRANDRPQSWASRAQELIAAKRGEEAVSWLAQRPGELVRRATHVARAVPQSAVALLGAVKKSANSVATPVLLQAKESFAEQAIGPRAVRAFMPKGGMGRVFTLPEGESEAIDPMLAQGLALACEEALLARFAQMPRMGKVWIDPALKKTFVPFAQRSASRALKTLARGSRLPAEGSVARLFVYWSEQGTDLDGKPVSISRADVDLSCLFLSDDFKPLGHVSWTSLRGSGVTHSGDITSAPNGACEFIDVDYDKMPANIAYVAVTAFTYTGQKFSELPECFIGWQGREHAMKGQLFDPTAVQNKSDCVIESTAIMPALLDIANREAIWADIALAPGASAWSMLEGASNAVAAAAKALALARKPNLFDLFSLHAQARGELVATREEADAVFSLSDGVTPFDFEKIAGEFLATDPVAVAALKEREAAEAQAAADAKKAALNGEVGLDGAEIEAVRKRGARP